MKYRYNNPILKDRRRDLRTNSTDAERCLWRIIRNKQIRGIKFWRQYSVGPYIIDFYCPRFRLAIEIDGGQHAEEHVQEYDDERTAYLKAKDINVLRFWNNEILGNTEGVVERIFEVLKTG